MIMNSQIREELTALLADHLTMCESARILRDERPTNPWERWRKVAEDAIDFVYGDENPETGNDPNHWSSYTGHAGRDLCAGGVAFVPGDDLHDHPGGVGPIFVEGPVDRLTLTGVFDPPTSPIDPLREKFVQIREDGPQFATEESDPARGSDFEQSAPSSPGQAEEAE